MLRIRVLFLLVAVSCTALPLFAQQRQPNRGPVITVPSINRGGDVRLEIQIVDENSRPVQAQALVEVTSFGSVNVRSYTNPDGRATFTVKGGTTYRVQASGADFKSDNDSFEILDGEMFHRETVTVKRVVDANAKPGAPGGMVAAAQLNVPEKARKEYDKGLDAFRDKKCDKAIEHFEKAIKDYPQFDMALNNLGVCAMQEGDVNRARDAFQRAVAANDRNSAASRNLGRILLVNDKDPTHAREMFTKSLSADPRSGETLTLLAYSDLQTGDMDGALANARKVHSSAPKDQFPFAHLIAGRVLERRGDRDGAAAEYRTYLQEAENTPDAQVAKEGLARLGMPPK